MTTGTTESPGEGEIRAEYDEFSVGSSTVAMISDPLNEHAWIQSTKTTTVRP
jgi:hypothetical protein